ncbi:hypothetical protein [Staphylococcus warneri]|uniref:hypothetical protein n=1 Tax=Staphylococcus warneri TaxID=1292 RepID=UPI003D767346
MINYMKSELYRIFHSKGVYIYLIVCNVLMILAALTLFDFDQTALTNYLIALVNMAPIVFGGLALAHAINSFKANLAIVIIIISIFYYQSAMILQVLTMISHKFDVIYDNSPTELFNQNFKEFMQESSQFGIHYWLIGVLLGLMFLIVGYLIYRNKEFID